MSTFAAAYLPTSAAIVLALAAIFAGIVVAGYALPRCARERHSRPIAWIGLVVVTAGVERLCAGQPPGFRMIAVIVCALLLMKIIVLIEEQARGLMPLPFGRWVGFSGGWIGMQPRLFAASAPGPLPGALSLVRRGSLHLIAGSLLVVLARLAWTTSQSTLLATFLLLPGLSLMLHFGACNLLAGLWRFRGVACDAVFRAPLRSQNLGEFWAKRWNLAFSEMTAIAMYRPLAARVGRGPALVGGFALSGLLHELAISVPVRAGFGLPLCYFLMHGGLVLVERAASRAGYPLHGWIGRVWVFVWVLVPLPILFHQPFLAGVIWPIIGIGAPSR